MLALWILLLVLSTSASSDRPNFVIFLADDLGIGDLSLFGNTTIHTKNIDRIGLEGAKLTHHLATAPICTPSRAALMTGKYAVRMGMEQPNAKSPSVQMYTSQRAGLPQTEVTWAKVLREAGYQTGAFGKWHLGWNEHKWGDQHHGPLGHGFDYFFGLPFTLVDGFEMNMPFFSYSKDPSNPLHGQGIALALCFLVVFTFYNENFGHLIFIIPILFLFGWFFLEHFTLHKEKWWQRSFFMEKYLNSHLMENNDVIEQPIKLNKLNEKLTNKVIEFIQDATFDKKKAPFAVYVAFPYVHTPLVPNRKFKAESDHGAYGDCLLEMDDSVGRILKVLDDLHLADNTVVYFASDHGCHIELGARGGSNRPFRGGKMMGALEGGIRVPGVVRWPKKIKPGTTVEATSSLMDLKPTIMEIIGMQGQENLDGKSILPLLTSEETISPHKFIVHYCGMSVQAIRMISGKDVYKAYFSEPILNSEGHCGLEGCPCFGEGLVKHEEPKIFDIVNDPHEDDPLKKDSERYRLLLPAFLNHFEKVSAEVHPPSQYLSFADNVPRPWMQPCANFPWCKT